MPVLDMRRLWLEGEYPSGFLARSPRSCSSAWNPTASGCNQCFYEVPLRRVWNGRWYVSERDHTSIQAQRYCRCMLSKPLNRFQREATGAYRELEPKLHEGEASCEPADGGAGDEVREIHEDTRAHEDAVEQQRAPVVNRHSC